MNLRFRIIATALALWAGMADAAFAEDPEAAARLVGAAGQAAAGAIARDAGKAATVPGYAGAAVPERAHTAAGMEDAARRALDDPDDPAGAVGRALVEGMTRRPHTPVAPGDPAVLRADAVAGRPDDPAWGADGLAAGDVSRCGAGLEDAGDGGACGGVTYCVGAGCERPYPCRPTPASPRPRPTSTWRSRWAAPSSTAAPSASSPAGAAPARSAGSDGRTAAPTPAS